LLLDSAPLTNIDPKSLCQAMLVGIRQMGLSSLPWTSELRDWQARLLSMRYWFPDEGWPEVSNDQLIDRLEMWLGPWLGNITRREHLSRLDLSAALQRILDHRLRARLNEQAPAHLSVPGGSRIRLRYIPGEPPVLA
ncbi:MAG TPA: ATP-dependent helicase HrpB, partial [Gammaproteobacteria bacterium]|nr:ATP-dependent helicase HrpB [Gammaproteobacteria bacterium]